MFLDQIKNGKPGILTYGITPPKAGTPPARIAEIAERTMARLVGLDIDALIVYDVQDESARTSEERPFPFLNALDPFTFASEYLGGLNVPKVIYRPAGKFSKAELTAWLDQLGRHNCYPVFVGVPSPGFPVKTTLPEAYQLWSKRVSTSVIGAVTIPERHSVLKDEDQRILDKAASGVSYFVSQCVFNVDFAKKLVEDLCQACREQQISPPSILFTLTACGSFKTLQFMEWLGIHIPEALKEELRQTENMLERSVEVCLAIAAELTAFCADRCVPFGFNVESVAIKKDEIEASIYMVNQIGKMLSEKGLRNAPRPFLASL
ncbi:5,10-methylenetetrahydrofolate reductase [Arcticibacter pallidicorallinus]|uniref:Methylenetetrahydrofolate reductase n=1 Tax=Arcticibacter pallidicorallinus TaxID=1259464 RepID=A0A2T0U3X1_9SPHI|nr:methylenetetrahydrofolate reductase [Arcticibacter pallidicorallinus]PRY52604.1 5,10-methylenetetrahydrofolate reductase [Arcticibacter pallidicorallinus]